MPSPPPLAPIRQLTNVDDDGTPALAAVDLPIQPATTISTEPPAVVLLEPTPLVEAATGPPSSPRISPTWCEGLSLEDMMAAILAEDEVPTPVCLDDFQEGATLPRRDRNPSPPVTGAPDESMAALRICDLAAPLANNGPMVLTWVSDVLAAVANHEPLTAAPHEELIADSASNGPIVITLASDVPAASPTDEPMAARNTTVAVPGTLGAVYEDIFEEEIVELSSGEDEEPDSEQDAIVISDEEDHDGAEAGPSPRYETPPPAYEVLFGPGPYPDQAEAEQAGETTANPQDIPNGNIAHLTGASPAAAATTGTTNATPLGDARVTGIAAGGPPAVTLDTTLSRAGGSSHGNHIIRVTTGQGNYTAPTTRHDPAINADAGTAVNTPGTTTGPRTPPRSNLTPAPHFWRSYLLPPADEPPPEPPPRACCRQPQRAILRRGTPTRSPLAAPWPHPGRSSGYGRAPVDRDPDAPADDRPGILRNPDRRRRAPWPEEEPSSDEEVPTDSKPEPEPKQAGQHRTDGFPPSSSSRYRRASGSLSPNTCASR
ncbi:fibrous sheath CABYR-binding protein-like [Drosophila kikkawai]|uniref:Fibrous sheath CABYR-binding protein-like n=1 Tax=Drosophila kikkawai TaxID=30033 RepID=A0ABM4GG68_DROKI